MKKEKIFLFFKYFIFTLVAFYLFIVVSEYIIQPKENPFNILNWNFLFKAVFNIASFFAIFSSIILVGEKFSKNKKKCECPHCCKTFLLDLEKDI